MDMNIPNINFRPREQITTIGIYEFVCPLCKKIFRYDDKYEPLCTGPNETLDEHTPTLMILKRKVEKKSFVILK